MQAGTPILCKRCGGNAALDPTATLRCQYCGYVEQLPHDEQARLFEVRSRLRIAAAQVAQLSGTESALGRIFEDNGAFFRIMGPFGFVLIVTIVYACINVGSALNTVANESVRTQLIASALISPVLMAGLALSFPIALLFGRISYAHSVRPLLRARPPLYPGAPMRCRACSGPLPVKREAQIVCVYCSTVNILGASLAQDAVKRLEQEAAQYRARASGVLTGVSKAGVNMTRVLVACFVITYVSILVTMYTIQYWLT